MQDHIERMLDSYEQGKVSRRDFVMSLAALAAFPSSLSSDQPKSTLKASNLNHVTLAVSDVKKSCLFYQRALGLSVLYEEEQSCNLAVGDRFLSLAQYEHSGYIDHFCLGVAGVSLDKAKQLLTEQSYRPFVEFEDQVYLHDPDGIKVQISLPDYKG